jgi:hypothetical protein
VSEREASRSKVGGICSRAGKRDLIEMCVPKEFFSMRAVCEGFLLWSFCKEEFHVQGKNDSKRWTWKGMVDFGLHNQREDIYSDEV